MMRAILLVICLGAVAAAAGSGAPPRDDHQMQDLTRRVVALEKENKSLKTALGAEKRRSNALEKEPPVETSAFEH